MKRTRHLLLKSETQKNLELKHLKIAFRRAKKTRFWKNHFLKYKFNARQVSWDNYSRIPTVTKQELSVYGLNNRFKDSRNLFKKRVKSLLLQSTSGTNKELGPVLFLKMVNEMVEGKGHDKGNRMLILYQGRAIALRDTIARLNKNRRGKKNFHSLISNPFSFKKASINAIQQFSPDAVVTFPSCINFMVAAFPDSRSIFRAVKHVYFSGDFISMNQFLLTQKRLGFRKAKIDLDYLTTEADAIGICCQYLNKKYGTNAYHPFEDRIVELIDIDEYGKGEVVVTKLDPTELSMIRYRTGDIAHAINEECKCGNEWTLTLEGRLNMDYIKSLGILITRAEIDRVLKNIKSIKDWRGEVREYFKKGVTRAEITLLLHVNRDVDRKALNKKISDNLLLTPRKTLSQLAREGKFMPLKIKVVESFPPSAKKAPLRKVLN